MSPVRRREEPLGDPLVRSLYRDLAGESAPAELDSAVLADARAAMHVPRGHGGGFLRPLAWAASVGLCVAVVLQVYLSETRGVQPAVVPDSATERHEAAVELRARKLGDAHREKGGSVAEPFADGVDADATGRPAGSVCAANFRSVRDEWLRCIETLEDAGDIEQAAIERERLERAIAGEVTTDD